MTIPRDPGIHDHHHGRSIGGFLRNLHHPNRHDPADFIDEVKILVDPSEGHDHHTRARRHESGIKAGGRAS